MTEARPCFHCGEPLPAGAPIFARLGPVQQPVCCHGCRAVAEFIQSSGLESFYAHRSEPLAEYGLRQESVDWQRYDGCDLRQRYVHQDGRQAEVVLDIGGMYCSACVWLLDRALQSTDGVQEVSVNPATRRAVVRWNAEKLPFSELLAAIARVGFKPQPRAAGIDTGDNAAEQRGALRRLIVAAAAGMQVMMFAVALYAGDHYGIEDRIAEFLRLVSLLICLPIIVYSARPFFTAAIRGLKARAPGMDLPVAIAIGAAFLASARATLAGEGEIYFDSVAMFVLFLSATRYIEMRTRHRADDFTQALAGMLPETVIRLTGGDAEVVALDRLQVGDLVLLRPGDVVPADGVVESGSIDADESLLTGESMPVHRQAGMAVSAGSISRGGSATVRVTLTGAGTSLAETARLLERARADRPRVAVLADRIASRFVLAVLTITALTGVVWLQVDAARAFEIVLATLVVTCPCALALATPAAIAATASRLAAEGFLMVRARVLEILARPAIIVFDKTGTLTSGRPSIDRVRVLRPGLGDGDCLRLAAAMETASEHVLARAFARPDAASGAELEELRVTAGAGVEARIEGRMHRIGNRDFVAGLAADAAASLPASGDATEVWLGDAEGMLAVFDIVDAPRADALQAVRELRSAGFELVVASGDRAAPVGKLARFLGIDRWHASLSPAGKLDLLDALRQDGRPVLMVGDGINDAPVLAAADASIAIDAGTALARASADAVVPGTRLAVVAQAADASKRTRSIIRQNISWAIGYNLAAVPLAASGILAPWMAAIGMSLSSLLVVGNATRLRSRRPTVAVERNRQAAPGVRSATP